MRRTFIGQFLWVVSIVFLTLAAPVKAAGPSTAAWFPLQSSNEWVLVSTQAVTRTITCTAAGRAEWQLTGLFDEPVFVRYPFGFDWNFQASLTGQGPWQTVFRFGQPENLPWRFNLTGDLCDRRRAAWTANDVTIVTPSGTYTGCRRWQSGFATPKTNDCPSVDPADVWFASRIGPVALQAGDGQMFLLTSATVGTQPFPPPPNGMEATLTADRGAYTNVSNNYIFCPPCQTNNPPCESPCYAAGGTNVTATFTFQVTNASNEPQLLTFLTGQRFDLQLIDTNGTIVAAWSDNRAFPQYASRVTWAPGETQDYTIPMVLADRFGHSLTGPYTARAFLTNTGPPLGVEATTSIRVVLLLVP